MYFYFANRSVCDGAGKTQIAAGFHRRNAVSCGRIAEKFVRTAERSEVTYARSGKIAAKRDLTCVSIVRIVAKGPRSRSFVQTGAKSDPIDAKYLVTGVSFDRIVAICVATGAISDTIGVTRDTDKRVKGEGGKRGRGKGTTFPPFPFLPLTVLYS